MKTTYAISGLKCDGCVKKVTELLQTVPGVTAVEVNRDQNEVTVSGLPLSPILKRALKGSKFQLGQRK
ncbi:heavy-metal-associated domain-containing protein [Streptococcus phocae subsp. phocae]|uniref:heavy-metal-associated domain-containing protein n=1 Tax=Streptococcus phocae TaxID=119224 RepID=UPI000531BEC3|nr:heavy metal-associated domain-containing protein [Streptococcus phocae]KGR73319.1 carbonate dehydratase [Streptococcus phocae subsp. salmonis]